MDFVSLFFLTSGLFLGWGLGANHLGNIFGTAVGSRMVSWGTAAAICCVFVVLGAVISGAGASGTLGRLGAINASGGAFMVALAAGIVMLWMTRLGLPVSTTQAIVGGIIGWNFFTSSITDTGTLTHIFAAWVTGPAIAAVFAILLFKLVHAIRHRMRPHLLRADAYTRIGLLLAGAFGAYSLGANNIANVMGVFVPVSPFTTLSIGDLFSLSPVEQLFLIGGLAIAVGVLTYSHRVVHTVGSDLLDMSPLAAWIVVMSHSLVLFLFASERLENFLASHGLPTFPLVPVSSSEVVVGAVLGIGLYRSGRQIRWRSVGRIALGWVVTPFMSCVISFTGLFVLQNVFYLQVYQETRYAITPVVAERMVRAALPVEDLADMKGRTYRSAVDFRDALRRHTSLAGDAEARALIFAEVTPIYFDSRKTAAFEVSWMTPRQIEAVRQLSGQEFFNKWAVAEALAALTDDWRPREQTAANKLRNKRIDEALNVVYRAFEVAKPNAMASNPLANPQGDRCECVTVPASRPRP